MSIEEWVEQHRDELVEIIPVKNKSLLDDEELEMWVMNDEGLYNWAISEGVEI